MKLSLRVLIASFVLVLAPMLAFAHEDEVAAVPLPGAGIRPSSPFFIFDRMAEFFQDFFTFNPAAKARLHITFAAERKCFGSLPKICTMNGRSFVASKCSIFNVRSDPK